MERYKYLIIGTGMTADSAAHGIRELDAQGSICMIGQENDPPYDRPPLTKGLWKGKPLDSVFRSLVASNQKLYLERKVVSLDPLNFTIQDDQGNIYAAEKILLATGGTPRRLPFGGDEINYYRTLSDFRRLVEDCEKGEEFAVIGGGFIGSEIAAALAMNGKKVTMIFPEDGIGALVYPHDLSQFLNDFFREKGVELWTGEIVAEVGTIREKPVITTRNGRVLQADGIVAGIGILPNLELADMAGLQTGTGIIVNENLVTSKPGIYAAGDVAEFHNLSLHKQMRVEHADNAKMMGHQAGRNMAGASEPYHHLPFFYSDLFELGYEAVGELNSRFATYAEWKDPYKKGIVYYLENDRVRGVLLWNVWDMVPAARKVIAEGRTLHPEELKDLLA